MNYSKKLRALMVAQDFTPLEGCKEGKLKGGFSLLSGDYLVDDCSCVNLANNCVCRGNNCGCPPVMSNNCTCGSIRPHKGRPDNCDCYFTEMPSTAAPTASTTNYVDAWPGLI